MWSKLSARTISRLIPPGAAVWKCVDRRLERESAFKVIAATTQVLAEIVIRFELHGRVFERMRADLMHGGDLADVVDRHDRSSAEVVEAVEMAL